MKGGQILLPAGSLTASVVVREGLASEQEGHERHERKRAEEDGRRVVLKQEHRGTHPGLHEERPEREHRPQAVVGILELIPAGGERDVRGLDDEGDQERVAQPLGCLARTGEVDGVHEQGHEAAHVHVEETGETAPGHGGRHD